MGRLGTLLANELSRVCYEYLFSPNHRNVYLTTQKENYAANLGLKVAFNTMKYIISNNLMPENLNSLPDFQEYTSEQLFFLSYANVIITYNNYFCILKKSQIFNFSFRTFNFVI